MTLLSGIVARWSQGQKKRLPGCKNQATDFFYLLTTQIVMISNCLILFRFFLRLLSVLTQTYRVNHRISVTISCSHVAILYKFRESSDFAKLFIIFPQDWVLSLHKKTSSLTQYMHNLSLMVLYSEFVHYC